jgi:hypothetical protein
MKIKKFFSQGYTKMEEKMEEKSESDECILPYRFM